MGFAPMGCTDSHQKLLATKNEGRSWALGPSQIYKSGVSSIPADIGWRLVNVNKRMRDKLLSAETIVAARQRRVRTKRAVATLARTLRNTLDKPLHRYSPQGS